MPPYKLKKQFGNHLAQGSLGALLFLCYYGRDGESIVVKISKFLFALGLSITSLGFATAANADTVDARCDVFPKGDDKATFSGLCSFSQRQGYVSIDLKNGTRYELSPTGDKPGNYVDKDGKPARRESGLGKKGQIYRLAKQSLFVYWDPAPYNKVGTTKPSTTKTSTTKNSTPKTAAGKSEAVKTQTEKSSIEKN
jgi:hypothetical protein